MSESGTTTSERYFAAIGRNHGEQWHISAFRVPDVAAGREDLVAEVRRLRARILYDRGRRPGFRDSRGYHHDDQELDYGAWHFVARRESDSRPLGYVRLSTPEASCISRARTSVTPNSSASWPRPGRASPIPSNTLDWWSSIVPANSVRACS